MLTDIFAFRYASKPIWHSFTTRESRLLLQSFRIVQEQICPFYTKEGKVSDWGKTFWTDIHNRLSTELGVKSLSPLAYGYYQKWNGNDVWQSGTYTMMNVCETWMISEPKSPSDCDGFMKERLSLIEVAFRKQEELVFTPSPAFVNDFLGHRGLRVPGNPEEGRRSYDQMRQEAFGLARDELNTRFRQAGSPLQYHNGFIQISEDNLVAESIETPFWQLISGVEWVNVDTDMKEALDLRDSGGRDPAFYAARALESAIKIISDKRGVTTGGEKSAYNFIENLSSKRGGNFISEWESQFLKEFFDKIRNPFGHGPGNAQMPSLSVEQTNWAIETCMVWAKSLIKRL